MGKTVVSLVGRFLGENGTCDLCSAQHPALQTALCPQSVPVQPYGSKKPCSLGFPNENRYLITIQLPESTLKVCSNLIATATSSLN